MDLRTYLFKHQIQQKDLAAAIGCHRTTIWAIIAGKQWPNKIVARRIEEFTDGKVTAAELLKDKKAKYHLCSECGQRRRRKVIPKQSDLFKE